MRRSLLVLTVFVLATLVVPTQAMAAGPYTVSLMSPTPPAGATTFTWSVAGAVADPRGQIGSVELSGCWTADQVASVDARDAANASLRTRVHKGGRTAGHIEVNALEDGRLPATVSVKFRTSFGSAAGGTTARVDRGRGNQATSENIDVGGPTCRSTYRLEVSAGAGGRVSASPSAPSYAAGTAVSVSAVADAGYAFAGWTVDGSAAGMANPLQLTMNADHTVAGAFTATGPPPDLVAPPLDPTVPTSVFDATSFLYTGPGAVQVGVAPGTIQPDRAAVLRGKVLTPDGQPLPGARITVLDHPEFGRTQSRADGMFDLAVNGGGPLTVNYAMPGTIPSQRQVVAPWEDFATLPDVVLVPYDTKVTTIDLGSSEATQVARATPVTDASGTRQATLLFSQGTSATMTLPNGSSQPLSTLDVRATELTVGDRGPASMPADLPPTSGYTYAAEFSVDAAVAAGATEVRFSKPVVFYVENFLGFRVGMDVPVGYYDRTEAAWLPSADGRVVSVVAETAGKADVDVNGDGAADDAATLGQLGIDDAERERLASLYNPGQSLWRTPVDHFSPWDCNLPYRPPDGATGPNGGPPRPGDGPNGDCDTGGSVISCLGQGLSETINIAGTPFSLSYQSSRAAGHKPTMVVPLSGDTVPDSLKRIELKVELAGKTFTQSFAPSAGASVDFTWDGKDAYGRTAQGAQQVTVDVAYAYDAVYTTPAELDRSFGQFGTTSTGVPARDEIHFGEQWIGAVGTLDGTASGLGGWTLNVHQAYDPVSGTLHFGTGGRAGVAGAERVISTVAGNGEFAFAGDGGPATEAALNGPQGLVTAPDGSVYVADSENNRVRRIRPDGIITTIAGTGAAGPSGDGGPATEAGLRPSSLALGPDGSLYVSEPLGYRVRRIAPNGIITTFAGGGSLFPGDGSPATDVQLTPAGVAVGPDGSVYITEPFWGAVRKVSPDGLITTAATGLFEPRAVVAATDGTLYIGENGRFSPYSPSRVRRLGPDGVMTTYAGGGTSTAEGAVATDAFIPSPQALALGRDGLYIAATGGHRVRLVSTDGLVRTVTGTGHGSFSGDGGPAAGAMIGSPLGVAVTPDGDLFLSDYFNGRVRQVKRPLPAMGGGDSLIPSAGGQQVFHFDERGRHARTLDALTGAVLYQFSYDGAGRLRAVTDVDGNVTSIERGPTGNPTGIVGPAGQRTTLEVNGDGYLARAVNPANEAVSFGYHPGGLLASMTEPKGGVHRYTYDAFGRLAADENPAGGVKTLTRTELADGHKVLLRTPAGLQTTYESHQTWYGTEHVMTDPAGARTVNRSYTDSGRQEVVYPDGRQVAVTVGADPRFGMLAPRTTAMSVRTPGGIEQTMVAARSVTLADPADPLSLQSLTDTATVNGQTSTQAYVAATRTLTARSPAGRESSVTYDGSGRVIGKRPDVNADPTVFTYGPTGLLTKVAMGAQHWTYDYDGRRRPITRTDAKGGITTYAYDDADRVVSTKAPNGAVYGARYDANGNRVGITMPNGAEHAIAYDAVNLMSGYRAPGNPLESWEHDLDRRMATHTRPMGDEESRTFDAGGRLSTVNTPEAAVAMTYADATDRASATTRSSASGSQGLAFSYDGSLTTAIDFQGLASPSRYSYSYDENSFLSEVRLDGGGTPVTLDVSRDADGLITALGPFTWARGGPGGAVSQISDGTTVIDQGHDGLAQLDDRRVSVTGTELYRSRPSHDALGLVAQKIETVAGTTRAYDYVYDANHQLVEVKRDGATVERYGYDLNTNRTSRQLGTDAPEVAAYDAQDRLVSRGPIAYQVNDDGFLVRRGADTFTYGTQGELLSAHVGDQVVTYSYDALGRRLAKDVSAPSGSSRVEYLYGDPGNAFRVTAVRSGGELTVMFYDDGASLVAFDRAGARYYVASDHLGSPRLVTNASGQVLKAVEYDAFGAVLSDSNPGFDLPIGYAGGLSDRETGLVHFGYRDYEPASGRWTTRDPVLFEGGQYNLYAYVANSPVAFRDPLGLWCVGGNFYYGMGAGAKVCHGPAGVTTCFEVGAGLGGGFEIDPNELGGDKDAILIEAGVECGPLAIGVGTEINLCGQPPEFPTKCSLGIVDKCAGKVAHPPEIGFKCGPAVKFAFEMCRQHDWFSEQ